MAKETRITCDLCQKQIDGEEYFTVKIHQFRQGSKTRKAYPTLWLCRKCFLKTGMTFPTKEGKTE